MFLFFSSLTFFFGLAVGSFLNAVIWRMAAFQEGEPRPAGREKGESALKGRSYCPHCRHQLSWEDLIPVVSFVLLGGKCRYCKKRISLQYPVIELSTALLFLLIFNFEFLIFNQFSQFLIFETLYLLIIASLLIVLFVYDLRHYILPDTIIFLAIGLVFGYHLFLLVIKNWDLIRNLKLEIRNFETLANPLLAGVLASAFFLAIFLLSRGRAMGFGDVKLAFFMGLFLGWPNILVALFVAFFLGAIIGLGLIVLQKKGLKSEIPFGPFLIIGTFAALFWGTEFVDWYAGLFLV